MTGFLYDRFGWTKFPGTPAGAAEWAKAMDGWATLEAEQQQRVAETLVAALGPGDSWSPPPPPNPPSGDPWWRDGFGPRLAVAGSLHNWYDSNTQWYKKAGNAYFLNYWYREFMVVKADALDFINQKMPWDYAAMSPAEFFAEMYALYYRPDAAKRGNIAQADRDWFDQNVGQPRTGAPAPPPGGGDGGGGGGSTTELTLAQVTGGGSGTHEISPPPSAADDGGGSGTTEISPPRADDGGGSGTMEISPPRPRGSPPGRRDRGTRPPTGPKKKKR